MRAHDVCRTDQKEARGRLFHTCLGGIVRSVRLVAHEAIISLKLFLEAGIIWSR